MAWTIQLLICALLSSYWLITVSKMFRKSYFPICANFANINLLFKFFRTRCTSWASPLSSFAPMGLASREWAPMLRIAHDNGPSDSISHYSRVRKTFVGPDVAWQGNKVSLMNVPNGRRKQKWNSSNRQWENKVAGNWAIMPNTSIG